MPVDCPFSLTGAPIWHINDSLFDLASIQPPLIPTTFVIMISLVTRNIDQTRFQCFAPTGNGLQVSASNVGTLTVSKQGKRINCYSSICYIFFDTTIDNNHPPVIEPAPYIVFDYQGFDFNATHRTIAWKFLNNQTCTSPVNFTIQTLSCGTSKPAGTWTTTDKVYSLPTTPFVAEFGGLFLLSIFASSTHAVECARLPTYIQVFPNGKRLMHTSIQHTFM